MEFNELIKKRKSIRKYKSEALPPGSLDKILSAGRFANSARNRQKWAFIVVTNKEMLQALVPACRNQAFVGEAAALIAVCSTEEYTMSSGNPAHFIDCSIALDHMQLAATSLELGTCWLGAFNNDKVGKLLSVPDEIWVVGLLTIGIPNEEGREKNRISLEDLVHYNKW
ncbi:nitroreductase family protein [bacterium]|nr:nitroreductase family protein [bacterium]